MHLLCETTCAILSYNYTQFPAVICLFNVNNRNTRTMCKICLKLTIKILGNFKQISHIILVFLLFTLSKQMPVGLLRWNEVQLFILRTLHKISNSDQDKWWHCTKNEVFHEKLFSKCNQICRKLSTSIVTKPQAFTQCNLQK